ncbi:hypothetical protein BC938DRAFT_476397 [Jimgerdemannia flammicorona]|uniref:Uncharacterized protein n=1 Tax=Jimgerdemannia flammicorona TaxID=994334 RepID=A0A433PHL3_9FUNG|nr:hypothetical protein BC938DRAFT_476397 [Jimgerdemannia flammicorona]
MGPTDLTLRLVLTRPNSTTAMSPTESETNGTHPQHPLIPRLRSHLHALPPEFRHALRVTLRAFALGWTISSIGSVLGLLVKVLASRTRRPVVSRILADILRVLQFSVMRNGMPWLFAGVFGGYKFVDEVMRRRDVRQRSSEKFPASSPSKDSDDATAPRRAFLATLLAAYLSLLLVHRRFPRTPTVDLTLFAIVRAMDVGAHIAYHSDRVRGVVPAWTLEHADVVVFAVASAEIMFAFFYEPNRLPK